MTDYGVFVLNPNKKKAGEWEAWHVDTMTADGEIRKYRSFHVLLQATLDDVRLSVRIERDMMKLRAKRRGS